MSSFEIVPIQAFSDNYIWLIHNEKSALVVDPGDATVVKSYLLKHQLQLAGILLTHKHNDHIGGVIELNPTNQIPVWGPLNDELQLDYTRLNQATDIAFDNIGLTWSVLPVPGHTLGHIAYYCAELNALFSGDCLFSAGCGRVFEGSYEQMLRSLESLTTLPDDTQIYCAHEYTLANLKFALAVEPNNEDVKIQLQKVTEARAQNLPSLPSKLSLELKINPFLRCENSALQVHYKCQSKLELFSKLRDWKNNFR